MPSRSRYSSAARWGGSAILLLACAAGCDSNGSSSQVTETASLEDQIIQQARVISQKDDQLRHQAAVIRQLQALEGARRLEQLVTVDRIDLERLSGGYDDDRDGKADGIVLYLKLFDRDGDVLKAAGRVSVRVVDIALDPGHQLLGQAEFDDAALKPLWFGRLMTSHYTIKMPWSGLGGRLPVHEQLTVMVTYTDLLTGRSHEIQRTLKVDGLGPVPALPVSDNQPTSQP